jgi:hypothetical protein
VIAAFDISALHCACGSAAVMCVDPGSDAQMDPVFDIVLRRPVAARGWCVQCFTAFAALIPHEVQRKRRASV